MTTLAQQIDQIRALYHGKTIDRSEGIRRILATSNMSRESARDALENNRVGNIASLIRKDFAERSDNSAVYEVEWELFELGVAWPVDWRYVGNASDARYRQLLGQSGYIQVTSTRGDEIAHTIATVGR